MKIEDDIERWAAADRLDPRWRQGYIERYGKLPEPQAVRYFVSYRFERNGDVTTEGFDTELARTLAIVGLSTHAQILKRWTA